ncbi:AMP-binding protein [Cumulibacter soli]|uniref:AMP-binding protein n=1 Tax=Cumulibacter soli TaxID=2546344 RepID=UPI0010673E5E|nr:AMP-binding protein [Cumulibacter soli]
MPNYDHRTLSFAFERALADRPDAVSTVFAGREWTFRQSYDEAARLYGGMRNLGAGSAEPIALQLDNSADMQHAWIGLGLGGAIQVPVNTAHRGDFLSHVLNDSGAKIAIAEDRYVERYELVADDLQHLRTLVVRGDVRAADGLRSRLNVVSLQDVLASDAVNFQPNDPASLMAYMYTSGTTGPSKGVEVTHVHAYTYSSREDSADTLTPEDRVLVTLPMFHLAGQWAGCYGAIIHQCACYIEPGFSASGFWPQVREYGITSTSLLGAMAEILQQQPRRDDDADNPLRVAGMSPLASDVYTFAERFGIEIGTAYGMSEIGAVMRANWSEIKPGGAGTARPGYELRIARPDGSAVATNEVGELWVRSADPRMMMRGYHGLPQKTAETIVDGWVHTGDAFRQDEDGHYYFVDRMKDALRRRGENISSFEVEKAINAHPQVLESAVVAAPSEFAEDEIKAVIIAREGEQIDLVELTKFLAERMPYFMVPRYIQLADSLPRTPTQKIQKHMLRTEGVTEQTWDREAAGIRVTRDGFQG